MDHNQRVNEWNLVISEVIEDDEGVYQCQIITKDNFEAYNITLKLKRNLVLIERIILVIIVICKMLWGCYIKEIL